MADQQTKKPSGFNPPCAAPVSFRKELIATARAIATPGRGILAADESTGTIGKRLAAISLENTEENRRAYRELLFRTEGLNKYISGAIMYEETLFQKAADGTPIVDLCKAQGIVPGIKTDLGLRAIPGTDEMVTQGLTDLDKRSAKYYKQGARFCKWRAVYKISDTTPSPAAIKLQADSLARYAAISQANGLVPIVEPEVLMDGPHSIEKCAAVSEKVYAAVFKALSDNHVMLEGILLKPNMITSGSDAKDKADPQTVASYTLRTLQRTVPPAVPGINFLSGGQTEEMATVHLNAINQLKGAKPWRVSFSFGRALQASAIQAWKGKKENVAAAQATLLKRAKANGEAELGKYGGDAADPDAQVSLFEKDYYY
mmetsp:Transcript_9081/g.10079  ORF Transcript_9081/g.10079 Transcript_9081/m.10079 type:complete len:372 (+) Transcript_9081:45-1160(+)